MQQNLSQMLKSFFALLHIRFIDAFRIKFVCVKNVVLCQNVSLGTIISTSGKEVIRDSKNNTDILL